MNIKDYDKYVLPLLFLLVVFLSYLVVKPFLLVIAGSAILAYVSHPLYRFFEKRLQQRYLSGLLVLLVLFVLLTVPLVLTLNVLVDQALDTYQSAKTVFPLAQDFFHCNQERSTLFCSGYEKIIGILGEDQFTQMFHETIATVTSYISRSSYTLLRSLPTKILDFGILFFLTFFFLVDLKKVLKFIRLLFPLHIDHETYIVKRLKDTTHAVVFGQIVTAMIQGLLGGIGFALFGLSNPVLFGILMMFFALIPMIGTALVWLPASIYMMITGYAQGSFWALSGSGHSVLGGILLFLWGLLIVGTIDNVIKPKLIGDKARLHPAVVFLGVFGGLQVFGFLGILLGPILLAIFFTFLDILEKEHRGIINHSSKRRAR